MGSVSTVVKGLTLGRKRQSTYTRRGETEWKVVFLGRGRRGELVVENQNLLGSVLQWTRSSGRDCGVLDQVPRGGDTNTVGTVLPKTTVRETESDRGVN